MARTILDHCGFEQPVPELAAWGLAHHDYDTGQQITADVVRHFRWLRDTGPFPDAEEVARAAAAEARARLSAHDLDPVSRAATEEVAQGLLRVEARRALDGTE
ncbi:hypothetical protein ACFVH7_12470 [Kitasatospora indigofera]|uniref:hypothetical protein n=1 Tax=Kitasatospora indigofera TaxID=67307 RepID=UPI003627EA8D